ncbi:hypothetical protein [Salipiger mangrovisoli]|uniref:Autotransporter domain-containing protein n=1 Tax=Salipiger mangrovisoli TaxID=2865933 RepID=A0ABR9X3R9_9RHOB|nr:hypothetical protein [Salipiger mangrovisoli]MBE9638235.1 hypothetical protein [Salipiger mangrovisoli]
MTSAPSLLRLALLAALVPLAARAQEASVPALDPAPLTQADLLSREIGFGIGHTALSSRQDGFFLGGYAAGGSSAADHAQDSDYNSRGLVLGWGWSNGLSAFAGYGQGVSYLEDDVHEARIRSYFLGTGYSGESNGVSYGGTLYMGRTHNKLSSPASASGSTDHDGRILGLSLRGETMLKEGDAPGTGLDFVMTGDVLRHATGNYDLVRKGGEIESRVTYSSAFRAELGAPMRAVGGTLRPYAAYTVFGGDQDKLTYVTEAGSRSFVASELLEQDQLALGVDYGAAGGHGLGGRLEAASNLDGDAALRLNLSFNF